MAIPPGVPAARLYAVVKFHLRRPGKRTNAHEKRAPLLFPAEIP